MPTFVIRHSPEVEEYLLWSTVVDGPASEAMARDEVLAVLAHDLSIDRDLAEEQARRRVQRADEHGSSERETSWYGYQRDLFWWRENAPETFGHPYEVADDPSTFVGRQGTRDELFDVCRKWR